MKSTNLEGKDAISDPFLELENESFIIGTQRAHIKSQPQMRGPGRQRIEADNDGAEAGVGSVCEMKSLELGQAW